MVRVLAVGGQALLYVWALEQRKDGQKSSYLKQQGAASPSVPTAQPSSADACSLPVHRNRTDFRQQDNLVPWKLKGSKVSEGGVEEKVFHRYYHTFHQGELEGLCETVEGVGIVRSYYDNGNWCVVIAKTGS